MGCSPRKGEPEKKFIPRCMSNPDMKKYDKDQRLAICYSKHKTAKAQWLMADVQKSVGELLTKIAKRIG